MPTYTNPVFYDGPWNEAKPQWLITSVEASREYANGDKIKGWQLALAAKIGAAWVALEPLDVNAAPTATGLLRVCKADGTEVAQLVTVTAAQMKTGGVFHLNVFAGAGYVNVDSGAYVEFTVNAAVATAQAGKVKFGVECTALCPKGEDPTRPTG